MSIDLADINELYRPIFGDPRNGTPDDISKAGCVALANSGAVTWNAWRKEFPTHGGQIHNGLGVTREYGNFVDFRDHVFCDAVDFSFFNFGTYAQFENCTFQKPVRFDQATFGDGTNFELAKFESGARFQATTFDGDVSFKRSQFLSLAFFSYAQFSNCAKFIGATFSGQASFNDVIFGTALVFDHATFECHTASFIGGTWENWHSLYSLSKVEAIKNWTVAKGLRPGKISRACFDGVKFSGLVDFSGNEFVDETRFSRSRSMGTSFWPERDDKGKWKSAGNGKIKELARFESLVGVPLTFGSPPIFHNCKFDQDTTFDGAEFPKPSGFEGSARAYRTLKLAFAQQQAVRQEQRFFRLEMAEEAKSTPWKHRYLYGTYALLSDYGFSLRRPLTLLFGTWILFAFIYGWLADLAFCVPPLGECHINQEWVKFSLLQGLPLPGLDSIGDKVRGQLYDAKAASAIVVVAVLFHKTFSLLALFLLGMALRNLFKMK